MTIEIQWWGWVLVALAAAVVVAEAIARGLIFLLNFYAYGDSKHGNKSDGYRKAEKR